ncbi:MAG TPA: DUF5590 domain-containing protein [Bacillota bacterium]|nr:DUF5590 domain-containing protein [Bacillota bacterium]
MKDISTQQTYRRLAIKRWIFLIIFLLCLLVVSYGAYLYVDIQAEKTKDFPKTRERIGAETNITHIDSIERYHDKQYFHIVFGKNEQTKEYIAFVPQAVDDEITVIQTDEIINEETIINQWEQNCQACELIQIIPAMIDDDMLWEVTYVNDDQYVFNYYTMTEGTLHEQIKLLQMFN